MSDTEKLKAKYDAFSDAWKLYKKYYGMKNHEQAKWDALVKDVVEYQNKYDCLMARTFAMGIMEQLEEDAKEYA